METAVKHRLEKFLALVKYFKTCQLSCRNQLSVHCSNNCGYHGNGEHCLDSIDFGCWMSHACKWLKGKSMRSLDETKSPFKHSLDEIIAWMLHNLLHRVIPNRGLHCNTSGINTSIITAFFFHVRLSLYFQEPMSTVLIILRFFSAFLSCALNVRQKLPTNGIRIT